MDRLDLETLEREVRKARAGGLDRDAVEVIRWAHALLGDALMMSTAFQKNGMVILHLLRGIAPRIPVFFLDTGFHFPETLEFTEKLRREWQVNIILKRPKLYGDDFKRVHGPELYRTDPDLCCHKNKVEPFEEILREYQGWIAGVRRDQGASRAEAEGIEILEGAKLKIQPLAFWGRERVDAYIREHDIPLHPLFSRGYTSIGCAPCTQPCSNPNDERAGRWAGLAKKECGLHTSWRQRDNAGAAAKEKETAGGEAGNTGMDAPPARVAEFVGKLTIPSQDTPPPKAAGA